MSAVETFDPDPVDAVWLRQYDEPDRAWNAFVIYRDLGRLRSLRKATRDYYELPELPVKVAGGNTPPKLRTVGAWSRRHDWVARARAYDAHMERVGRLERIDEVRQMNRRHAAVANVTLNRVAEKIRTISADDLSVRDTAILFDLAVKVERLARGEATEITGAPGSEFRERGPDGRFREATDRDPVLAMAARDLALAIARPNGKAAIPTTADEEITDDA